MIEEATEDDNLVPFGFVKSLHKENERTRRDTGLKLHDQSNDLVKKYSDKLI